MAVTYICGGGETREEKWTIEMWSFQIKDDNGKKHWQVLYVYMYILWVLNLWVKHFLM